MDIRKLQRAIVDGLEDVKAQDIQVFNTEHLSSLFERVIIASGTSNRQTKALAASVRDAVRSAGMQVMRTEGEANGEWIIVDCAAAVVHLMQPAIRQYYQLEEIWGDKPVVIKLKSANKGLVKASESDEEPTAARKASGGSSLRDAALSKPAAKKTSKTAAKKPAAKKVAQKVAGKTVSTAPAAKKAAAKKVALRRTVGGKTASGVKTLVINAPVSGKSPARKAAAKKAPGRSGAR